MTRQDTTDTPDLSVIIPVHNAEATIGVLLDDLLGCELRIQVVVVDDASTDDSAAVVDRYRSPEVVVLHLPDNRGAGHARNVGFPHASGRYSLFFDADDEVDPRALAAAVDALDTSGADVAFLPYHYRRADASRSTGMNEIDRAIWQEYALSGGTRTTTLPEVPRLLGFSNYPWNKVIRTAHYVETGLEFGETTVHNDILGHWMTLLGARTIVLLDREIGTHILAAGGNHLSHRMGAERLQLFDALDQTYLRLADDPVARARYAHHYWDFVLRVADWALPRLSPALRREAAVRLQDHILGINLTDLTHMRLRRNPSLADNLHRRALA